MMLITVFATLLACANAQGVPESEWGDTDTTTALWRAISSGDKEALETLLDADEKNAHVRAADGRGPLWWAHEHKNEEAIELLQAAGCDEEAQDRDGLTAAKVGAEKAGQKTAWAIALEKKQAEEAVKRDAELAEAHAKQAAAGDDEWDEDWDEDEEQDEDWEEYDEL